MGKRGRPPKGTPNQLVQWAQEGKVEQFAKSLASQRVRISKRAKGKKPSGVREGLVRRAENEITTKDADMREFSWQIDVIFPVEHVQCVFYVLDFLQRDGTPYFKQERPEGDIDGEVAEKEWTLELVSDGDGSDSKMERKRELEMANENLHFKGGCAAAKALVTENGEEALLKQRVSFWWPYEQEWYPGEVTQVYIGGSDRPSARMQITFDDGDSLTRGIAGSIWRLETTEPTEENKEASLVKALAPPSLQEAVRPQNLEALYKMGHILVEQGDEKSLYVCTVDTGRRHKAGAAPNIQVGTTSDHTVAIISQEGKQEKRKREVAFVIPECVAAEQMQATVNENGRVRVSVPVRKANDA